MTLWSYCHACGAHWSTPRVTCPSETCRRARRLQLIEDLAHELRDGRRAEAVAEDVARARCAR